MQEEGERQLLDESGQRSWGLCYYLPAAAAENVVEEEEEGEEEEGDAGRERQRVRERQRQRERQREAAGKKRLVVVMATHNQGRRYMLLGGFRKLRDSIGSLPFDVAFVNDPDNTYYLASDGGALFLSCLRQLVRTSRAERVALFGSSMSGYAALLFAQRLGGGAAAVANNPQADLEASRSAAWEDFRKTLDRALSRDTPPPRLQVLFRDRPPSGPVFVVHGTHPLDALNADLLFSVPSYPAGIFRARKVDERHVMLLDGAREVSEACESVLLGLRTAASSY